MSNTRTKTKKLSVPIVANGHAPTHLEFNNGSLAQPDSLLLAKDPEAWLRKNLNRDGFWKTKPLATPTLLLAIARNSAQTHTVPEGKAFAKLIAASSRLLVSGGFAGLARLSDSDRKALAVILNCPEAKPWRPLYRELLAFEMRGAGKRLLLEPGIQSHCESVTIMRRSWSSDTALLGVSSLDGQVECSLNICGRSVLDGSWQTTVTADGKTLAPIADWNSICWFQDNDGQYLEWTRPLENGAIHDRHFFMATKAPLLIVADALRGPTPANWGIDWQIPADANLSLAGVMGTRWQQVHGAGVSIACAPLTSPCDPLKPGCDRMSLRDGMWNFQHQRMGQRTIAVTCWTWHPVWNLKLDPWRILTITNDRTLNSTNEAFAVRVPIDGAQCIFFRSLEHPVRRAFLGHQTFDETIIGRFNRKGDIDPWLRVE